jgi:hypothetical protein
MLECWDGLRTPPASGVTTTESNSNWVLVIGATNRPWSVDPAVLRRMPRQILVGLPDAKSRADILRVQLRRERIEPTLDLIAVAEATEGFSGSDLKEVVRAAALMPIREAFQAERAQRNAGGSSVAAGAGSVSARPISTGDLLAATEIARPTGEAARDYRQFQGTNARTSFTAPVAAQVSAAIIPAHRPHGSSPGDDSSAPTGKPVTPVCSFGPSARANSIKMSAALEESVRAASSRASAAIVAAT